MAGDDGGGDVPANIATVELEAMRKEDFSWHPCQVSLCPSGVGLILDYGDNDFKDIIVNKEDALNRLRIRSIPLQGDDCSEIQQGDHVIATRQSQNKSLFFEAEVEKVLRVRHSKRVHCRCTFTVKWLHQEFKETVVVSSSSIMKLSTGNIIAHPTISAFMNTVKILSFSKSPQSAVVNDMDDEIDLQDFMEKHTEEISNSADVSKKKIAEGILSGVEVKAKGHVRCKSIAASKASHIQNPPDQNQMMRSTRSRSKLQTEIEVKDPPHAAPSIVEELTERRTPLNPLASRAALASLMFKLPQNLEFSIYHEERKRFSNSADITTNKEITVETSNGTKDCISSVVRYSSMREKHSSKIGDSSVPCISKTDSIVKSLFSRMSEPRKPELLDANSDVLVKKLENENYTPEVIDSRSGLTCSTAEKNISQPTTRLTRSATQKSIGISDDNINKNTGLVETEIRPRTNRGRLTRSNVHKEEFQYSESKKVVGKATPMIYNESDSYEQIVDDHGSYVLYDQIMVTSQINTAVDLLPNEESKKLAKEEARKMKHGTKRKTCAAEEMNSNHTRRLTHSAVHMELGNKMTDFTPVLEENEFSEYVKTDLSQGHVADLQSNVLEMKESISSPICTEITLPPAEGTQGRNKRRNSDDFKPPEKTEENGVGNKKSSRSQKKSINSSKQELRFSPRLSFLSRTRSQHKS